MLVMLGLQGEQARTGRTSPRPIRPTMATRPTIITHQTKHGHKTGCGPVDLELEGGQLGPDKAYPQSIQSAQWLGENG